MQGKHYNPWGLNLVGIHKDGNPDHKFQYNGKEKQTELGLNWSDYGARMYDAQLGRWHVADALADKYQSLSPYTYVANNPLKYIDPDGKDINIAGTAAFRKAAFNDLQKLTNTKLVLMMDGSVKAASEVRGLARLAISATGSATARAPLSDGGKPVGTKLVANLINDSDHLVTIKKVIEGDPNYEYNITEPLSPEAARGEVEGGSDSNIYYDPSDNGSGILNADGTPGRDPQVGLGHELGHAYDNTTGKRDDTKVVATNPDDGNRRRRFTVGEIRTRKGIDNDIRKEQGNKARAIPKTDKENYQ